MLTNFSGGIRRRIGGPPRVSPYAPPNAAGPPPGLEQAATPRARAAPAARASAGGGGAWGAGGRGVGRVLRARPPALLRGDVAIGGEQRGVPRGVGRLCPALRGGGILREPVARAHRAWREAA